MKQFFKFTSASILGTLIALFIAFAGMFLFLAIVVSVLGAEETVTISDNTVLEIELNYSIPERTTYEPAGNFSLFIPEFAKEIGVNDIIQNIQKAQYDPKIAAIFLNLNNFIGGSYANIHSIREALIRFKNSGKMLIAHGHRISQKAYYLASGADKIYLSPTGELDIRGISLQATFFKKTLDKLEIEPQIFQAGKYKSAVETFSHEKMSEANREQLNDLIDSYYAEIVSEISNMRGINEEDLKLIIENYKSRNTAELMDLNLVDGLKYYDEVVDEMKRNIGIQSERNVNKVRLHEYDNVAFSDGEYSKNRIAVIYANGEIHEGKGDEYSIGMENITKELSKARKNKNVKAIVLRVNSPGGSPLTSEMILRECKLAAEIKPVIASFGEVAASGGYYISAGCTEIYSDPFTITGSIGAFGIIPNMQKFFDDKLGITFDSVDKGKYAGLYNLAKPLTGEERTIIQSKVDTIYNTFLKRVAAGRNMPVESINEIAQGRVWSGNKAKEIGLVDEIGGLEQAVIAAADNAGIDRYEIIEYPSIKEPLEKFMELLTTETKTLFSFLSRSNLAELIHETKNYILERGILTRIPIDIYVD